MLIVGFGVTLRQHPSVNCSILTAPVFFCEEKLHLYALSVSCISSSLKKLGGCQFEL